MYVEFRKRIFPNHQTILENSSILRCSNGVKQNTKFFTMNGNDDHMLRSWGRLKKHQKVIESYARNREKPINATIRGNTDTASRKSSGHSKSWQRLEGDFVVLVGNFSLGPSSVITNYEVTHKLQVPIAGLQILTMEIVFLPLENESGGSPSSCQARESEIICREKPTGALWAFRISINVVSKKLSHLGILACPWNLVNGLFHPYVSRLDTSPK